MNSLRGFESHLLRPTPELASFLDVCKPTTQLTAKLTAKRKKEGVLSLENVVQLTDGFLLYRWQDMGVDVHRHADLAVP